MSDVLILADARSRGINLPSDDTVAQAILDETEAFLARELGGPLTGSRTETFYVGTGGRSGKLSLSRYTSSVSVADNGTDVDSDQFRLVDRGSAIARNYSAASWWWTGAYVAVTYEPNDLDELTSIAYQVLALSSSPAVAAGDLTAETIGAYRYERGGAGATTTPVQSSLAARKALVASLKPKVDALHSLRATRLDYPQMSDWASTGIVNQAEPPW